MPPELMKDEACQDGQSCTSEVMRGNKVLAFESNIQILSFASASDKPSATRALVNKRALPILACPAPTSKMICCSKAGTPSKQVAPNTAAKTAAAVLSMSSLKVLTPCSTGKADCQQYIKILVICCIEKICDIQVLI